MSGAARQLVDRGQRVVAWFSCGDASAVAAKFALKRWGHERVKVVRIRLDGEHPDNDRFSADCERWFDHPVQEIRSAKYADHWEVIEKRRFINGPGGALCTSELKRRVREDYQDFDDIQVFGFTDEERQRASDFRAHHPEIMVATPLIDEQLSKDDCHGIIARAGIEIPAMYRLGYANNNCVGCVKGGLGYWNKIRRDFPETFDRMARLERQIGRSCNKEEDGSQVWLDELDPNRGRMTPEPRIDCGITCFIAQEKLGAS